MRKFLTKRLISLSSIIFSIQEDRGLLCYIARRNFSKIFARNPETGRFDIPVKAKEIEAQLKTLGYNIRTLKREKNGNVKDR